MTTEEAFFNWALRKIDQQQARITSCVGELRDEDMWLRGGENENAIGNLLLHLCGNMRQWIGHGVAGKPNDRDRDSEFNARGGVSRDELLARFAQAVGDTQAIIQDLAPQRLVETTRVQNYDVTVLEAIAHVVEHLGYHTGQIVFVTKALTHKDLGFYGHLRGPGVHKEATP